MDHRVYMEQAAKIRERHRAKKAAALDKYNETCRALVVEFDAQMEEIEAKRKVSPEEQDG